MTDPLPPDALLHWQEIRDRLRTIGAIFLDYDGTLSELAPRPELATLPGHARTLLAALAALRPTVVVSGRARENVAAMVGLPQLFYAGSHGFDIAGPPGSGIRFEAAPGAPELLHPAARRLDSRIGKVPGILIEDKVYSVAVHYRLVPDGLVADVERAVREEVAQDVRLRVSEGKKILEIRPDVDWHKGRAVTWLLRQLGLDGSTPLYIGDDVTDEDALRTIRGHGIGIVVADHPRPTAARYSLRSVDQVHAFLNQLRAELSAA